MSRGKYLSLEEARKLGKLDQFAKEHPSKSDGRFWPLLKAMAGEKSGETQKPPRRKSAKK